MMSHLTRSFAAYLIAVVMLTLIIMVGCQTSNQAGESGPSPVVSTETARTLTSSEGSSVASIRRPPQSLQDLVNRSQVIVIGSISQISGTGHELGYDKTEKNYPAKDLPYLRIPVTYYDIAIEKVLLDDGNVLSHPSLRMSGEHNPMRPQVGERFLFTLGRNPDSLSYGIAANWNVLPLDGGSIRNYDGASPGYEGVTDENSLIKEIGAAVLKYEYLPPSQWPSKWD